jgi:hypothetical protein
LLEKYLDNSNWVLSTVGISYRMGILTGKLRGYDNEGDLLKLVEKRGK